MVGRQDSVTLQVAGGHSSGLAGPRHLLASQKRDKEMKNDEHGGHAMQQEASPAAIRQQTSKSVWICCFWF